MTINSKEIGPGSQFRQVVTMQVVCKVEPGEMPDGIKLPEDVWWVKVQGTHGPLLMIAFRGDLVEKQVTMPLEVSNGEPNSHPINLVP